MQGWNEQTDWEDGGDWPGRPDNGAAYPAAPAGHPDDLSRSSRHPGTADPHHRPDPDRSDRRTEPAWSVNRPDLGLPDQHPDLDRSDQRPDPDWSDEPDHHRQYPDGGWQDEPTRTGRRTGAGWSDEPTEFPHPGEAGWTDEATERWRRAGLDPVDEPTGRREHAAARWADEPADLGAFALGRDPGGVPGRRVPSGDLRTDGGPSDRNGSGRHRRPTPLRGPVGLGIAVTALLGLFGVGAALLPPSLADTPAGSRADQPAVEAAGPEQATDPATPEPSGTAGQTATPTPTTTATRPAPKPKATTTAPKSPRTSSPAARRTPARSGSGGSAAGSSQEAQVLAIVNRERAANGCAAVVINSDLAEAARLHSQDQGENTNMSHTGSDGSDFVERARRAGYDRPIGENVAMGYENAAAVMDGWMNSSGHRANILNCDARAMGVGVATGADGRLYWTQVFGAVA
ncbi:CAP domain-containing protein [Plantactinospora sp. KLBMP9567]|uniref:CAP domain-containing protein n=1 Tax=Plantactinospora sp. KLBMP9567 TaxID=3085900 RepID=UPI002981F16C|nr:CAP domain-containing protein [Plantactinospora sp. KLBMP9567]MDW5324051.1 CAP domain-containing protein [Plantactinospora sp. KLBMP9567]